MSERKPLIVGYSPVSKGSDADYPSRFVIIHGMSCSGGYSVHEQVMPKGKAPYLIQGDYDFLTLLSAEIRMEERVIQRNLIAPRPSDSAHIPLFRLISGAVIEAEAARCGGRS